MLSFNVTVNLFQPLHLLSFTFRSSLFLTHWVTPEKIHTPTTERMLENLTGGGVNSSGNSDGKGALNLKTHLGG